MEEKIEVRSYDGRGNPCFLSYHIGFFGRCFGVVLSVHYTGNKPQVMFHTVVEDDGLWFEKRNGMSGTSWLAEYIEQLKLALDWCEQNCVQELGRYNYLLISPPQKGKAKCLTLLLSRLNPRRLFTKLRKKS